MKRHIRRALPAVASVAAAVSISGCEGFKTLSLETEKRYLKKSTAIYNSADKRAIISIKVDSTKSRAGRITPTRVVCAEPSPDVAKAVSEAFKFDAQFAGQIKGVPVEAAVGIAKARAEALAELTERLATIQLLRDALYRACEAYANGALSRTNYAAVLSGVDQTMVTMLLGELAVGAFGRQLARIGTSAGIGGNKEAAQKLVALAKKQFADAEKAKKEADEALGNAAEKFKLAKAAYEANKEDATAQKNYITAREALDMRTAAASAAAKASQQARQQLELARLVEDRAASVQATATTVAAGKQTSGQNGNKIANVLSAQSTIAGLHKGLLRHRIQSNGPVWLTCLSALEDARNLSPEASKEIAKASTSLEKLRHEYGQLIQNSQTAKSAKTREIKQKIARISMEIATHAATAGLSPLAVQCMSTLIPWLVRSANRRIEIEYQLRKAAANNVKKATPPRTGASKTQLKQLKTAIAQATKVAQVTQEAAKKTAAAAKTIQSRKRFELCVLAIAKATDGTADKSSLHQSLTKCLDNLKAPQPTEQ